MANPGSFWSKIGRCGVAAGGRSGDLCLSSGGFSDLGVGFRRLGAAILAAKLGVERHQDRRFVMRNGMNKKGGALMANPKDKEVVRLCELRPL